MRATLFQPRIVETSPQQCGLSGTAKFFAVSVPAQTYGPHCQDAFLHFPACESGGNFHSGHEQVNTRPCASDAIQGPRRGHGRPKKSLSAPPAAAQDAAAASAAAAGGYTSVPAGRKPVKRPAADAPEGARPRRRARAAAATDSAAAAPKEDAAPIADAEPEDKGAASMLHCVLAS